MKTLLTTILLCLTLFITACQRSDYVLLGTTTTLEDSGLLAELLTAFTTQHDIVIKPIIAGSGQIHELIRRGDIDTAITHDPSGEQALLTSGLIEQRLAIAQNDYLIVGPNHDPAHLSQSISVDEVFKKIVNTSSLFISRGDNSGTHQMEQYWWQQAQRLPQAEYYQETGMGMGATLTIAAERNAYTIVDRGTWFNFSNKQSLKILFAKPEQLPNTYSLLSLGKDKAQLWESWLSSKRAQDIIINYQVNSQKLFFPVKHK